MQYIICSLAIMTLLIFSGTISAASKPAATQNGNKSSRIVCYEKTPNCYVTKDSNDCLIITNEKPVCKDGSCVCEIKGTETKAEY